MPRKQVVVCARGSFVRGDEIGIRTTHAVDPVYPASDLHAGARVRGIIYALPTEEDDGRQLEVGNLE